MLAPLLRRPWLVVVVVVVVVVLVVERTVKAAGCRHAVAIPVSLTSPFGGIGPGVGGSREDARTCQNKKRTANEKDEVRVFSLSFCSGSGMARMVGR
jgi:hypothetical protein